METSMGSTAETVYIVDDDVSFARGLARLIGAAGWNAEVFTRAEDFLSPGRLPNGSAACVLLDVRMPDMRGPDLYRAMLARKIDLPVIFLTGHGDVPTSVDAMKLGAVDFLEKPVLSETLVGAIRVALARNAEGRRRDRERREVEGRLARLTPREHEVMAHVVAGRLNKQIAADLGISLKTVKAHRAKVMQKMDAKSLPALVDLCRHAGIGASVPFSASREAAAS
jgi:FixJ family two-component response regulator